MEEIEVRILDINREEVIRELKLMGAKKVFEGEIKGVQFDFEDGSIKSRNDTLRIRTEGNKAKITYKEFVEHNQAKARKEYEVEFKDLETMQKILEHIGLKSFKPTTKRRISYVLHNVRFEFDVYTDGMSYIPEFLEIEGPDIQTIYKYAKRLGFTENDCKAWSTRDVAKYYKNKK